MSLKFAALGDLHFRPRLGAQGRAEEKDLKLEQVKPFEPILITFGWKGSAPGAIRRLLVRARQAFASS